MYPKLTVSEQKVLCYLCLHQCNSNLENGSYSIPVCYNCVEEHMDYTVDLKDGTMTPKVRANPLRS